MYIAGQNSLVVCTCTSVYKLSTPTAPRVSTSVPFILLVVLKALDVLWSSHTAAYSILVLWCYGVSQLQKVTVPVLRAYLKGVGAKTGGKKQDLIEAVKSESR